MSEKSAVREFRGVVRRRLRPDRATNKELLRSLGWLAADKKETDPRVTDFEHINQRLNELMDSSANMPPAFRDVGLLAKELGGNKIPTLESAREDFYLDREVACVVSATIERAVREYPAWAKINEHYQSRGTPAAGALIEGFGAFLGSLVSGSENAQRAINRHYVLAFEEVLILERPDSPLVEDVIGWMKEEAESFPAEVQPAIRDWSDSQK